MNAGTEHFLGDTLGSVRQLTDASGAITYARAYAPYGVVTSTIGDSQTIYAYTGEVYGDSTQLTYLRSRFYASGTGRFLTRDTWMGDYNRPLSLNRWNYTHSNPVNYADPSGHCIFGIDTLFCIAVLVGVPAMAGITTAAWDYFVEQGHGVGGANQFNPNCVDWGQVFSAGKYGSFGAVESFIMLPVSLILTPSYGVGYFMYGMHPSDVNEFWIRELGLGNLHASAMQNPYYVSGRAGGSVGSLAISLHMTLAGLPTISAGPGAQLSGYNTLVLSGMNVTAVGGDLSVVYTGTAGLVSSSAMMSGVGGDNNIRIPKNATVADVVGKNPSHNGIPVRALQNEVDPRYVEEYATYMKNGNFDWNGMNDKIEFIRDSNGYVLASGHHRFVAAKLAGVEIPNSAVVIQSDVRPIIWPRSFEWTQVRWSTIR